ncbi:MAG: hypothetical protein H7177_17130 [Rhizobacter sp.]|nr:hypothetical protein [Bacteriovorax sp.]
MKKLLLIAIVAVMAASCSTFDKWKTPATPDAGVAPGEKSSYLMNKPDSISAPDAKSTATTTVKKKKKKKVVPAPVRAK